MSRRWPGALVGLLGVLLAAPAAGAIETTRFGIQPADADRLTIELRPGHRTDGEFEVWNKTGEALTLALSVVPATVDEAGDASLTGPTEPVSWAEVEDEVRLAPRQRRTVELRMSAPRRLPDDLGAVAVLVQPAPGAGDEAPAVLQRLALVAHLERGGRDLPDLWPWAGVAIAAIVAVIAQIVVSRRRRLGGSRSR